MSKREQLLLQQPTWDPEHNIEFSVHKCSNLMRKDLQKVFPEANLETQEVSIVVTFQPTQFDLVSSEIDTNEEKDRLLINFMDWAESIIIRLRKHGQFADALDPSSGHPLHSQRSSFTFNDLDTIQRLLPYQAVRAHKRKDTHMCACAHAHMHIHIGTHAAHICTHHIFTHHNCTGSSW